MKVPLHRAPTCEDAGDDHAIAESPFSNVLRALDLERRRSQALGILILALLLIVFACLRYWLRLG